MRAMPNTAQSTGRSVAYLDMRAASVVACA
jgi:hypothetical protein